MAVLFLMFVLTQTDPNPPELPFKGLLQLNHAGERFDLSGIVQVKSRVYVVADKEWNKSLYEIEVAADQFSIVDQIPLRFNESNLPDLDLEGVDHCCGKFYLVNEFKNEVLVVLPDGEVEAFEINYQPVDEKPETWGRNSGLEGVAVDCENQIAYLAKERSPRFLLSVDLGTGVATGKHDLLPGELDISDLKYSQGYLYVLERASFQIVKLDVTNMKPVARVSYASIANSKGEKLFEPAKYGMAEALLLTEDEIWLGLDNNDVPVSQRAKNQFEIEGNNPVILVFDRPEGF